MPARPPKEPKGIPFGRYRLLSELGEGGMGIVWKAWDTAHKRFVALKQLHEGDQDPERLQRFLREARLVARLSHPGIVAVLDAGEIEGEPYFATELIEGASLAERMKARVEPRLAAEWALAIAEALAYAHSQGVIHRDVKPSNVLIDGKGRPRIADFGLAKQLDAMRKPKGQVVTKAGTILGTPSHLSPEQATGDTDSIGPASDQFSLGVVLYELLTGRLPFDAKSFRTLVVEITRRDPAAPTQMNPSVPRDLGAVCLRALAKRPSGRYASMEEMAKDLRRFLAGQPTEAGASALGRLARWAKRLRPPLT